jgi:hypothetical protein
MFDLIQKCPRHSKRPWLLKKGCSVSSSFEQGGARFTFKGYVAVGDISLRVAFYPAVRAIRSSPLSSATLPIRARRIVLRDRRQSSEPGHPSDWSSGGRATSRVSTHRNVVDSCGSRRALRLRWRGHDRLFGSPRDLPRGAPHHPIGVHGAAKARDVALEQSVSSGWLASSPPLNENGRGYRPLAPSTPLPGIRRKLAGDGHQTDHILTQPQPPITIILGG